MKGKIKIIQDSFNKPIIISYQGFFTPFFVDTHYDFIGQRYGGWSVGAGSWDTLKALEGTSDNLISWYDNKGYHALPAYTNALNNALLRAGVVSWTQFINQSATEGTCVECDYGITTFSEPMILRTNPLNLEVLQIVSAYGTAIVIMIAFSFVPASCITYLIAERQREEKQV